MNSEENVRKILADYWLIKKWQREFPKKIPLLISSGDPRYEAENVSTPLLKLYFEDLPQGGRVLDVGAGDKQIEIALKKRGLQASYFSLDSAQRADLKYDYSRMEEAEGEFDLVIMEEVIEHLSLGTGYSYLRRSFDLLRQGGFLVVTTPNTRHPVQFLNSDFTHQQHYPMADLYGLLRSIGFAGKAAIFRLEIRPPGTPPKERLIRSTRRLLFRLIGFDYAHGILIKVQK